MSVTYRESMARTAYDNSGRNLKRVPKFLREILGCEEFWTYFDTSERANARKGSILPLKTHTNRALLVRLVGFSAAGAASKREVDTLLKLCVHGYGLVATAAAVRLAELEGETSLRILSDEVDGALAAGNGDSLAESLRVAEGEVFGMP